MFRFHILGLLRKREPFHGYALMKEYNRRTGRNYGAGYFYRQLGELMTEGMVRQAPNPLGADPRRTPYQITEAGLDAFGEWFEDIPRDPLEANVDQVARAMFFSDVDPDIGARVLAMWQRDLLEKTKVLERELQYAHSKRKDLADMRPMLIRRDLFRVAADLEFLEDIGETLNGRRKQCEEVEASPAVAAKPQTKRKPKARTRAVGGT
ncbi:MAG: PadR family transcriptional regulator [Candidatus Binatia bacterium]|nr:PadR family transcriptional regulator [Candidatus Binatia bacterium]